MSGLHVAELWRYPVKSLRGERLDVAEVRPDGIVGDRLLQVRDADGALVTARTRPDLLGVAARLDADGVRIGGVPWQDPAAAAAIRAAAGPGAAVARSGEDRFDDTPLLVATDGCAATLGIDHRRLRPNILVAGASEMAERHWPGRVLRCAGGVEIEVEKLCARCVITTVEPDTLERDTAVLERINRDWGGRVALNCYVRRPGRVEVGEAVEFV